MAATFDATWDFAALSNAVCDTLVDQGKIRAKPAFIRGDRQTKIAEVCRLPPPPHHHTPLIHPFPPRPLHPSDRTMRYHILA